MNRIYKVVWSKAKNCYTVVSEIAKRHGKGNRARTCAAAFLAAFALTGVMGMSEAQAAYTTIDADTVNADTLNAKYNLNVGEQAANGFTPFFVDSNGAFHAAAKEFSVNKDGKVTAAAGEIGGVTIKEGNITGVQAINTSAINTNVLNSKYNLSVGTANENGTMPFFVNSNGAFYGANNNFSVDKDGKVIATAGEIGNVVLQNGVYTGHSALRDGELFVGDASGNYSQITTKGAKLGKVTVAADGKISGVAAGAVTADSTDAVNGSQLHAVATEAGKHSKVVNGSNINVEETDLDGQKVYKVNLNKDIMLGDLTGKNVSISGTNGTIEATGAIATKDRVYADKGAKLADIDVTGDTISNGDAKLALNGAAGTAGMINGKGASVYMQDGYTVINSKVAFDQNGKISGVAAGINNNDAVTKNILFEVTDKNLLDLTGGIVQGMSGSPIIQGDYIIGAVTHVVVDDPTKGYGIFITKMLEEAEN